MPHIIIEYSANVAADVDIQAFCNELLEAAVNIDAMPMAGIRVRAFKAEHYAIADGQPSHGFIDISVRLRAGRSMEIRQQAVQELFAAAKKFLTPVMARRALALSFEMRDIDPDLSPKFGTIRDYL